MLLRDARPTDAGAIAAVARSSWHAAYDDLLGTETVDATVDSWYDPDSLRDDIDAAATAGEESAAETPSLFIVAESDDDIVGFTNAGPARGRESDPDADAFLSRLYVHPDEWGEGVATALTARLAQRLDEAGYERVWLEVFAENEVGRGFYESLGFDAVARTDETFDGTELTTLQLAAEVATLVNAAEPPG
jgi:ribosomal protein S18 acetylase RimI-like enzyme